MNGRLELTLFLPPRRAAAFVAPWMKGVAIVVLAQSLIVGAVALAPWQAHLSTEDMGLEDAIEFADDVASTSSDARPDASDVEQPDRAATPKLEEKLSAKQDVELPPEQASPEEAEHDLRMAQEKTQKQTDQPAENVQATEALQAQDASQSSRASVAADSMPQQDGEKEADRARAPDVGTNLDTTRRIAAWQKKIFAHIARFKRYPEEARSRNARGEIQVSFNVNESGAVSNIVIVQSSGIAALDGAALDTMRRADPLPQPPNGMANAKLVLPMRFQIR